jgi:2-oxoglutarate dehydrogenase E1 component
MHVIFADLYDQYLVNPDTVEPSWRAFFSQGYDLGANTMALKESFE